MITDLRVADRTIYCEREDVITDLSVAGTTI